MAAKGSQMQMDAKWEPKDLKCRQFPSIGVPCGGGTAALLHRTSKVKKAYQKVTRVEPKGFQNRARSDAKMIERLCE